MRMRLYDAQFVRPDGVCTAQIVAPNAEAANQLAVDYHEKIGVQLTRSSLMRIDKDLPPERQDGLNDMLEYGPVGFASWLPPIGWFVHTTVRPSMKLYRIEDDDAGVMQIIAPNADAASAIWLSSLDLGDDGAHPMWRISDGMAHLDERQQAEMLALLEFSPPGVVTWDEERGWMMN